MLFNTQKALTEYVNTRRSSIGITVSVRITSETDIPFFYALLQRHPDAATKSESFSDFMICRNELGSGLEMRVVRADGLPPVPFSIPACITGKGTGTPQILGAMRFSIVYQIMHFKQTTPAICPSISSSCTHDATDADHIIHFEKLSGDFLKLHPPPTLFGKAIANQPCFLPANSDYEEKWQEYHQQHAVLRYLCGSCNRTRPKWDGVA